MAVDKGGAGQPPSGTQDAPDGYEDLTRIDQGGFATVYRARDTRFDRTVALKILRSDSLDDRQLRRFNAECLATGRVSSHPNIVTVYDAGTTRGHRPWMAMEYCSGGSLAHKVAAQGSLPVAEVISIGARLCSALHAAHEAGILHRDVKPHNVLLTSYGEPALADFGIASVTNADDTSSIATETAAYTVVHAAPEILEGGAGTAAADLYSLGSTLYTLLAGQAPFAREARIGLAPLVTRILSNDVPAIARPGVPPELEKLLRRCLAARPQDRPATAAALGTRLAGLGTGLAGLGTGLAGLNSQLAVPLTPPGERRPAQEVVTLTGWQIRSAAIPQAVAAAARAVPAPAVPARPVPAAPAPAAPAQPAAAPAPVKPPTGATSLLVIVGGALGLLLAVFTAWGLTHRGSEPGRVPANAGTLPAQAADRYAPKGLAVVQGNQRGELIVTWRMPIRPDVVATVIYEGPGAAKARSIVNYDTSPGATPKATVRGLTSGRRVCLSTAHLVSLDEEVTSALSSPVCAVPR